MKPTTKEEETKKAPYEYVWGEAKSTPVKIYTRHKGPYTNYLVVDKSEKGHRRLRSFADHEKAKAEAKRIANLMDAGQAAAAQISSADAASLGRARELLRPTGRLNPDNEPTAIELACSVYAKAVEILGSDRVVEAARYFMTHNPDDLPPRTVTEVKDELIAAKESRGKSEQYLRDLRSRLAKFAEAFQTDIASVTTSDVQRWLNGLKGEAQTLKNYRRVVGTLFKFAERLGYIFKGTNPVKDTEPVEVGNGDAVEIYTPKELRSLLESASEEFKPCIAIGAFAGLRTAEIERIEWSDIDLKAKHITVAADKAKTASRRIVPILPCLASWLAPFAKAEGKVWKKDTNEFRKARDKAAKNSGVDWKLNALRHSFVSYRLADVQSAAQVSLEAGNSPGMVFRHYRELVKPKDAKRWFAVRRAKPGNVVSMDGKAAV